MEGEEEEDGGKKKKTGGGVYNDEDITRWDRVIHFPILCGLCNPDYLLQPSGTGNHHQATSISSRAESTAPLPHPHFTSNGLSW